MTRHKRTGAKLKKYWGVIPIAIFFTVTALTRCIELSTDSALRSIPQMIFAWFGGISLAILIFWIGKGVLWKHRETMTVGIRILRTLFWVIYSGGMTAAIVIGIFCSVFFYSPEHVVERNGTRMVASVHSFLQENVYYYAYRNVLFRGAEPLGWEDYGNGGADPFQQEKEPYHSFSK